MTPLLFGMRGEEEYRGFAFVVLIPIQTCIALPSSGEHGCENMALRKKKRNT